MTEIPLRPDGNLSASPFVYLQGERADGDVEHSSPHQLAAGGDIPTPDVPDPHAPSATPPAGSARAASRGRRARPRERSFASSLGLQVLGAVLPGTAFVATGRRVRGFLLLALLCLGIVAAIGVLLVERDPAMLAAEIASRPTWLMSIAVATVVVAGAWIAVIVANHVIVRPASARGWQRVAAVGLTLALCAGVLVPAVWATRASVATYNLVTNVFEAGPEVGASIDTDGDGEDDAVVEAVDREDPWQGKPRLNLLLLGGDSGDDREGLRTDSVILASIDTQTGDTVLLSLPRNLENVPFPPGSPLDDVWPRGFNCGYDDGCILDAIYGQGLLYADQFPDVKDPGAAAISDAVSATLGLDVDYYLMVNLAGFEQLVNALGGVDINVGPERIPMGGTDVNGNDQPEWRIEEWVPAGQQHLDGRQALWYSRSRWQATDYDRMQRQRCMLNAIVKQANPQNLLTNYLQLASTAEDIISTNVPYPLFPAFVELAGKVKSTPVRTLAFTDEVIPDRSEPDFGDIRQLVRQALDPPPPTPTATSTPPASSPPTTTPGETTDPDETPSIDPTQAVVADAVCA